MHRSASPSPSALRLAAATALCAALLAACGGGSDASSVGTASIDDATATTDAADATQIGSDAMSVADAAVLATQALVAAGAEVSARERRATTMTGGALAAATRLCTGGGSATLSITGGTPESEVNGELDAGEVYQVTFAACSGAAGFARLDGTLAITVDSASGDSANGTLGLSMTATNLSLTLPHGGAALDGSAERQYSVSTDADGTVHLSSHFTSPGLTLATHYFSRASSFTLGDADIVRTATVIGGVLQSSTIDGHHTLSGTLPNASFSYSVATVGGVTYAADGTPTAGQWTVALPETILGVTVAAGTATVTIDSGKDGTIDRTITIPVSQLVNSAG